MIEENAERLSAAICDLFDEFGDIETEAVLIGVSAVLAVIIREIGMSDEKAMKAFAESLKESRRCRDDFSFRKH